MATKRTEKVAICDDCAEWKFAQPLKIITRLVTICNACGQEQYCSLVLSKWLSPRKDKQVGKKKRRKKNA